LHRMDLSALAQGRPSLGALQPAELGRSDLNAGASERCAHTTRTIARPAVERFDID
jgi:hypothetical protein